MKNKNRILITIVALLISATFLLPQTAFAQTYSGIDVSSYNEMQDYALIKASGIDVVITKATEGTYYTDKYLSYRAINLPKYFKIGYYHFAGRGNATIEAQYFLSRVKDLYSDTVLFLDIEQPPKDYGWTWTKQSAINYTNEFTNYIKSHGYKVGIYTNVSFYRDYLQGNILDMPLWLATYSSHAPTEFSTQSWQYSEDGRVNGILGSVDLDFFTDNIFINNEIKQAVSTSTISTLPIITDSKTLILQQNLNKVLRWSIAVDGIYGNQTKNATKQVQRITGIEVDGIAGNQTNSVINQILARQTLRYGSKGAAVRYLQYRLGITADGIFGYQTQYAVKQWQRRNGLYPDGVVGQYSWKVILD